MQRLIPAVMFQGTGSNVGKSTIVAGVARALVRRGLGVVPFKPQNMSNNAAVTVDGGEIGRAQALQARAARRQPIIDFNPVLLKPEADTASQVIVHGKRTGVIRGGEFGLRKRELMPAVLDSFRRLSQQADIILVEGAGSPAEINLRLDDITNMGFAEAADVPVVLIGDIDRGGVIASLVGTHTVLPPSDRSRIFGFLINKFRGDLGLFKDGIQSIEMLTGWTGVGIIPWLPQAAWLPAEDALDFAKPRALQDNTITVAVPMLARIANFDDLDPLGLEPNVRLVFVRPGQPLPAEASVVIIPGSKATIADLAFFREQGWDIDLYGHVRRGGVVLGLCGGFQMLGQSILDEQGIEGPPATVEGLRLLDVVTVINLDKTIARVAGHHCGTQTEILGYEIHLGRTEGPDCDRPVLQIGDRPEGACSANGRVQGTCVHGLFASDRFRRAWLDSFGISSELAYEQKVEAALEALADHVERHVDLNAILSIAQRRIGSHVA
jgi:adenosylcobyric acid synthase